MIDIRKRIQDLCKEKGITQKELADKMGVTPVALSALLQRGDPHLSTTERLANVFGMSLSELMLENKNINSEQTEALQIVCPHCRKRIGLFPMVMEGEQV